MTAPLDTKELRARYVYDWVATPDISALCDEIDALRAELARYSMSAGHADQRRAESRVARVALGFEAESEEVAPVDIAAAVEALRAKFAKSDQIVKMLKSELKRADSWLAEAKAHAEKQTGMLVWHHAHARDLDSRLAASEAARDAMRGLLRECGDLDCGSHYCAEVRDALAADAKVK